MKHDVSVGDDVVDHLLDLCDVAEQRRDGEADGVRARARVKDVAGRDLAQTRQIAHPQRRVRSEDVRERTRRCGCAICLRARCAREEAPDVAARRQGDLRLAQKVQGQVGD